MGVRRGAWEQVRRGNVWKPGMLVGGVHALSMGDALRQRARAAQAGGKNPWLGVADGMLRGLAGIGIKLLGVYKAQEAAYEDACAAKADYVGAVKEGALYDPRRMAELDMNVKKTKAVMDSYKTKVGMDVAVDRVSTYEAMHSFLAGNELGETVRTGVVNSMLNMDEKKGAQ